MRKRLTKQKKLALLHHYETQIVKGQDREDTLDELVERIGVTSRRQVERILEQARRYEKEIDDHLAELSDVAMAIANNLDKIRSAFINIHLGSPKVGDLVYHGSIYEVGSGQDIELQSIGEEKASNLLAHLRNEFPELENIDGWHSLPRDEITESLIMRLRQKGYQANFQSKCSSCPY